MGSVQSYISLETALTALVIAGAVGVGYNQLGPAPTSTSSKDNVAAPGAQEKRGKKKKQKLSQGDASESQTHTAVQKPEPLTVPPPELIPGQFDATSGATELVSIDSADATLKAKKKKKKAKAGTKGTATEATPPPPNKSLSVNVDYLSDSSAQNTQPAPAKRQQRNQPHVQEPPSSSSQSSRPLQLSTASLDTDGSWTRVGSRRNRGDAPSQPHDSALSAEPATSDTGITTSATGNSSPAEEHAEAADSFLLNAHISSREPGENRRTLAEKLLPKPRKTGVDDMLEVSDYPAVSRVMRVQPLPSEKPALGFSWADYEDVRVTTDGGENDADGEDDGWGVVQSKRSKTDRTLHSHASSSPIAQQKAPETLTKRQRQNLQRREKEKAAKADAESERQATLAKHKRELEKAKMVEQYSTSGGGKTPSGGMKATVDERGKLVWE